MGVKSSSKKTGGKRTTADSKPAKKSPRNSKPEGEKKESNKGKRGSSREKELTFKGDKKYAEKSSPKKYGERKYGEKPQPEGRYDDKKRSDKPYGDKKYGSKSGDDKRYGDKSSVGSKTYGKGRGNADGSLVKKKGDGQGGPKQFFTSKYSGDKPADWKPKVYDGKMRLNKFLSNAGIASRRDADKLIELGLVSVNGKVITELGFKVDPLVDAVKYDDKNLKPERLRYVLLNKPKDYITTMDDPEERKTVMFLVKDICKERIYPVGRLDRQTTGLLLFTNDGELAKKLTHPKHGVQKLYHVETIEKIKGTDIDAIREGVKLEDGFIQADEISFVGDDPRQVGIRIHSGQNRIVRRIFEHFNYTVKKLDRVMYAGLTKKDLGRGRCRMLTEQEINYLKMIR